MAIWQTGLQPLKEKKMSQFKYTNQSTCYSGVIWCVTYQRSLGLYGHQRVSQWNGWSRFLHMAEKLIHLPHYYHWDTGCCLDQRVSPQIRTRTYVLHLAWTEHGSWLGWEGSQTHRKSSLDSPLANMSQLLCKASVCIIKVMLLCTAK